MPEIMNNCFGFNVITYVDFDALLQRYEDAVPQDLKVLDKLRLQAIPEVVQERKMEGRPFLEKTEVIGLAEWTL